MEANAKGLLIPGFAKLINGSEPFASDEERLEHLFQLYEEMTAKEKLV